MSSSTTTAPAGLSRRTLILGAAALGLSASAFGIATAAAPSAHAAASRLQVGFSVNSGILWEDAASRARSLDAVVALGGTSIRMDLMWYWIEQRRGVYDWRLFDTIVNEARARGLTVLGVLTSSPAWAAYGTSPTPMTRPASASTYATFARAAAQRYRGRIYAYEIWNEPNARGYFDPDPDPVFYAQMVAAAAPAIKRADPSAIVIAGALGPTPAGWDGMMPALQFLDTMLATGIGSSVDAMSFHPYDEQTLAQGAYWDGTAMRTVTDMHARLRARGLGAMKIWATEYGAPSADGVPRQAELITTGMSMWAEMGITGPMYIHHHKDQYADDSFGLLRSDHTPKDSAYAVQSAIAMGVPERGEAAAMRQSADASLGRPTTPVYAVGAGLAQDHEQGVRFLQSGVGWTTTAAVGDLLRRSNLQPKSAMVDGRQWVDTPYACQVFSHATLGTHFVIGEFMDRYEPSMGFPEQGAIETQVDGEPGTSQTFQHAVLTWRPVRGTVVTMR